jgi:hypothetical protein
VTIEEVPGTSVLADLQVDTRPSSLTTVALLSPSFPIVPPMPCTALGVWDLAMHKSLPSGADTSESVSRELPLTAQDAPSSQQNAVFPLCALLGSRPPPLPS